MTLSKNFQATEPLKPLSGKATLTNFQVNPFGSSQSLADFLDNKPKKRSRFFGYPDDNEKIQAIIQEIKNRNKNTQ